MRQLTESEVHYDTVPTRLDKYLAERFTYQSRTKWRNEIHLGNISVNGEIILNHHKIIKPRDFIIYEGEERIEPEVSRDYSILYEDEFLIAVNKPANLPVHPSGIFFKNTLLSFLEIDYKIKLYTLHRIDRETSGIVLFGKNSKTAGLIQTKFHNVTKSYLAIVHGIVSDNEFTVDVPLGFSETLSVRKKRVPEPESGEEAKTVFKKILPFGKYTLLKAIPVTGRQHQIRAHLKFADFPIVGDKIYGLDEKFYLEFIKSGYSDDLVKKLEFKRSALHSRTINFYHPDIKKKLYIKAPLPEDLKKFILDNK